MSVYKSFKKSIKRKIPQKWWGPLSRVRANTKRFVRWNYWKIRYPGTNFCCPYCKSEFAKFIPYVNPYEVSNEYDIISGQSIARHACPHCLSKDRERLLYFYITSNGLLRSRKILHFAPERKLYDYLSSINNAAYVCADLDTKNYSHLRAKIEQIDITSISYPDESFDIVICNHVLEHIPDDMRAMKEIFRVLKKSGTAILMVPMGAKLQCTQEDATKITEEERSVAFGQYDHVRVYAEQDYIARLTAAGFEVKGHLLEMADDEKAKYGINPREKIWLGIKH